MGGHRGRPGPALSRASDDDTRRRSALTCLLILRDWSADWTRRGSLANRRRACCQCQYVCMSAGVSAGVCVCVCVGRQTGRQGPERCVTSPDVLSRDAATDGQSREGTERGISAERPPAPAAAPATAGETRHIIWCYRGGRLPPPTHCN